MSIKKIICIAVIYALGWAGWWTLGTVTSVRSHTYAGRLGPMVAALWGRPLSQDAPRFWVKIPGTDRTKELMPEASSIRVDITPDYRKKGLLWYSTYNCEFDGIYTVKNHQPVAQTVYLHFDFPAKGATYDAFAARLDGRPLSAPVDTRGGMDEIIELAPGKSARFHLHYRTRGLDTWEYRPVGHPRGTGRVKDFSLTANTGFTDVDFLPGSLSPMEKAGAGDQGMTLEWKASDLITNSTVGIIVPKKLNPGPLTTRITYFAPVCLLFFFILVTTMGIMYNISIHPMHFLFVTAGFFSFHLLLSYLAGHVWIHLAFLLSAAVSVGLVTFYLSAALGDRFPWKIAVAGQLFFLVLFSYTFFIEGITGIIVACGTVVTLGVLMKVTAGVDWDQVFKPKPRPARTTQRRIRVPGIKKARPTDAPG
ncbi:MAG: inner membrane CreD family protein [Desulfobacter sp.]|nr:MAG: inner membrane CreD family protein [Desulfobacter sp.]